MYKDSRCEIVLRTSCAVQGNFYSWDSKHKRRSSENQLAKDRQWEPEVFLYQDLEELGVSTPRGFAELGGLSMLPPSLSLSTSAWRQAARSLSTFNSIRISTECSHLTRAILFRPCIVSVMLRKEFVWTQCSGQEHHLCHEAQTQMRTLTYSQMTLGKWLNLFLCGMSSSVSHWFGQSQ